MKKIVILSDIHCGNKLAVAPPDAEIPQENEEPTHLQLNAAQKALYGFFSTIADEWHHPDIMVVNGELVDGQGPKSSGIEQWTTDLDAQLEASKTLIEMFKPKRLFVTRGSDYHVTLKGNNLDEVGGKMMGAERVRGHYSSWELYFKIEEVDFNFSHHIMGTTSFMYRGTAHAREMMMVKLNETHKWPARVIVRSHVHYYWDVGSSSHRAISTPCWQLQNWYAYRKSAGGTVPDVGAVQITVDGDSFDWKPYVKILPEFKPPRIVIK